LVSPLLVITPKRQEHHHSKEQTIFSDF